MMRSSKGLFARALGAGLFVGAHALSGCGGAPTEAVKPPVASTPSATPTGNPPFASAPVAYPKSVDDLAAAVPRSATLAASVPGFGLIARMPGVPTDAVLPLVSEELAKKTGLSEAVVRAAIEGFDGAELFLMPKPRGDKPPFAAVLRFRDAKPVEAMLAAAKLERVDEHRYRGQRPDEDPIELAWLAEPRVAIVGSDAEAVNAALDALAGKTASFQGSPLYKPAASDRLSVVADLAALVADAPQFFDAGSKLSVALGLTGSEIDYVELGSAVPRVGAVLAPTSHDALARLPGHALFAVDLSAKRRQGKSLRDLLVELGRPDGNDHLATEADAALHLLTDLGLDDLDRAMGDSIALAGYLPAKGAGSLETRMKRDGAILVTLASRDDKTARAFLDKISAEAKKHKRDKTTVAPGKLTLEKDDTFIRVEAKKDVVVIAMGAKQTTSDLLSAFGSGKGTLGEDPSFVEYKKRAARESHVAQYADLAGIVALLGPELGDAAAKLRTLSTSSIATDLTASPTDKGIEVSLRGDGVVGVVGAASALAVYGVRRYLAASKGVEARVGVSAIARGAVTAFERESITGKNAAVAHKLCDAATPVPAKIEKGAKYAPSTEKGKDFETGSDSAGWRCLRFSMSDPIYFQYEYRVGHGYKGPARGGPNPGPKGFEASAEGDLDGDGKTSLYTMTGKVGSDGMVHLDPEVFVSDEGE